MERERHAGETIGDVLISRSMKQEVSWALIFEGAFQRKTVKKEILVRNGLKRKTQKRL